MNEITSYQDLVIWQKGIRIAEDVYQLVKSFPGDEIYALTNQIRRSTVSIPSNIAEGYGRRSTQSYIQFVKIARGSLYELETQLILAEKFNYINDQALYENIMLAITEEGKMINSFLKKLESTKV